MVDQGFDVLESLAGQFECVGSQRGIDLARKVAFVDQGYTGPLLEQEAKEAGMEMIVVKLPEAKRGFILLLRRWVVKRSFAWTAHFRCLARDFERTPETFRSLHFIAFAILLLHNFVRSIAQVL